MTSPIRRASFRVHDFMDRHTPGEFANDGEVFEAGFDAAIEAVREEFAKDARARPCTRVRTR